MPEEENPDYTAARNLETRLPCLFCRHYELCDLWEDGRKTCPSFSGH